MTRYVALLRGINVGSHHRIKMPVLKGIASDLGYEDPTTYLQSGNLTFTARAAERTVVSALTTAITAVTGFEVPVVLRNHRELTAVVADNPLPVDPKLLSVIFSSKALTELGVDPDAYGEERLPSTVERPTSGRRAASTRRSWLRLSRARGVATAPSATGARCRRSST
ncbi:MAG TPA: DUF1697 domain-containing protein [Mycobacteriales bacterium]